MPVRLSEKHGIGASCYKPNLTVHFQEFDDI